jgi:CRISPR-associated protein Cas2
MMVLITYDVNTVGFAGQKRLRKVAKACEDYGQRVQNSVFQCLLDLSQLIILKHKLLKIIDPNTDSLRVYYLGKNWQNKVEHFGLHPSYTQEEPIIF